MNESVLISILIPVYNGELYIERCLESICNQTYANIEVVVVDDGSTDNTLEIIQKYAAIDSRIKFYSKPNSGPSATRNFALEKMKGEYVFFVDADDWIESNMVKYNADIMRKYDVDMVVNDFIFDNNGKQHVSHTFEFNPGVISRDNLAEKLIFSDSLNSQCISLYDAKIIRENELSFPMDIHSGEDNIFNLRYCKYVKRGYYTQKAFYHYEMHNESGCRKLHVNQLEMYGKQIEMKLTLGQKWGMLSDENKGKLYRLIMTHLAAFTLMAGRENLSYAKFRNWINQIWNMPQFTLIKDEQKYVKYTELPKAYCVLAWLLIHRKTWLCFVYCRVMNKMLGNL